LLGFLIFPLAVFALAPPALAQSVTVTESFRTNTLTSSWTLSGTTSNVPDADLACLTVAGGTRPCSATTPSYNDASGQGWLRLSPAKNGTAADAILNASFPLAQGFDLTFTYATYGSTTAKPADGFSVFLIDPSAPNAGTGGVYGGALGYCQVKGGVIGIGIDEYGNFPNTTVGVCGTGPGFQQSNISVRAGAAAATPWSYLGGTGVIATTDLMTDGGWTYPALQPCATAACQRTGKTIRVRLYPDPVCGTGEYRIVVKSLSDTTIDVNLCVTAANLGITNPDMNVQLGFGSSTGSYTAYHEIRDVTVDSLTAVVPDLSPALTINSALRVNTPTTVTLKITNNNNAASTNGQVDVVLPPGITLINPPAVAGYACSATATGFRCTLPGMAAGGSVNLPFQINAPASVSGVTITAVITGVTAEVNTANNSANLILSTGTGTAAIPALNQLALAALALLLAAGALRMRRKT